MIHSLGIPFVINKTLPHLQEGQQSIIWSQRSSVPSGQSGTSIWEQERFFCCTKTSLFTRTHSLIMQWLKGDRHSVPTWWEIVKGLNTGSSIRVTGQREDHHSQHSGLQKACLLNQEQSVTQEFSTNSHRNNQFMEQSAAWFVEYRSYSSILKVKNKGAYLITHEEEKALLTRFNSTFVTA